MTRLLPLFLLLSLAACEAGFLYKTPENVVDTAESSDDTGVDGE